MSASVSGAHHVSFPVRDLSRSRMFYEGVLGLRQKIRPDFPFAGVWYEAGACEVHLIEAPAGVDTGTPPPTLNPMAGHAAFAIRDYAAMLEHLEAHALEVLETTPEQGQMWVRDPDGHIIELIVAR
jgi:glyoxylase I family protein